ncbi:MAG TPA: DedA family protein [Actinomycetes bacterium]
MGSVVDHLLSTPTALMYVLVGLLVFAEDALFVGFVLPGETAAILGGVDASRHHVNLAAMIALVVAAAILGDNAGFEIGHRYGPRILTLPIFARHQRQLTDAERLLARRGGGAVFLGRFVAFFRALMPALAGIAHMPYRRFLLFNAAGGLVWGTGAVVLGFLAGNSYKAVERTAGQAAAATVALIVLLAVLGWRIRRRRLDRRLEQNPPAPSDEEPHV